MLMALMDFQNHLFYMVVHTTISILEMKKKKKTKKKTKTRKNKCLCSAVNLKFEEIGCVR